MFFITASNTPVNEKEILIAFIVDGDIQLISGWYDLNEEEYYSYNGELIEEVKGWADAPMINVTMN